MERLILSYSADNGWGQNEIIIGPMLAESKDIAIADIKKAIDEYIARIQPTDIFRSANFNYGGFNISLNDCIVHDYKRNQIVAIYPDILSIDEFFQDLEK